MNRCELMIMYIRMRCKVVILQLVHYYSLQLNNYFFKEMWKKITSNSYFKYFKYLKYKDVYLYMFTFYLAILLWISYLTKQKLLQNTLLHLNIHVQPCNLCYIWQKCIKIDLKNVTLYLFVNTNLQIISAKGYIIKSTTKKC